jgi:hypothetical protein
MTDEQLQEAIVQSPEAAAVVREGVRSQDEYCGASLRRQL